MTNCKFEKHDKVLITGAAGLVGQNLVTMLLDLEYRNIVAIDKHAGNLAVLARLHAGVRTLCADLAEPGRWQDEFGGAAVVVQLHAQITGNSRAPFERNNVDATRHVLRACRSHAVPYLVHISSSVVNSAADDDYTNTKKAQEQIVLQSGLRCCVLRPTLMFGWFDPKHLGWLARFMEKAPVFPVPGHGRYIRQPLYNRDFCRVIVACMEQQPERAIYDLVGPDEVTYIDIIRTIREVKGLPTPIVRIPYGLFYLLLKIYALFSERPPFTADQLKALTAGDRFVGVDMRETFGVTPTPFRQAIEETFRHPRYSGVVLESYI